MSNFSKYYGFKSLFYEPIDKQINTITTVNKVITALELSELSQSSQSLQSGGNNFGTANYKNNLHELIHLETKNNKLEIIESELHDENYSENLIDNTINEKLINSSINENLIEGSINDYFDNDDNFDDDFDDDLVNNFVNDLDDNSDDNLNNKNCSDYFDNTKIHNFLFVNGTINKFKDNAFHKWMYRPSIGKY